MWSGHSSVFFLLWLLLLLSDTPQQQWGSGGHGTLVMAAPSSPSSGSKAPPPSASSKADAGKKTAVVSKKAKKNKKAKLEHRRYADLAELVSATAEKVCRKVGKQRKSWRQGDRYTARCDLLVERAENMALTSAAKMMEALKSDSMADVLATATQPAYFSKLKNFLKTVSSTLFDKKARPPLSAKDVDQELMKDFNQWFLNVLTKKEEQQQGQGKVTPEIRRALQRQGYHVPEGPEFGGYDEDDYDDDDDDDGDDRSDL